LGIGYWVLGIGYWVLGVGCWVLGVEHWVFGLDASWGWNGNPNGLILIAAGATRGTDGTNPQP